LASVEPEAEAVPEESPQEETVSTLAEVTERLRGTETGGESDRTAALEQELSTLRAQWQDREATVDKLIASRETTPESKKPSIQDQLSTPEVARLVKDAQDSEDETALPRLIVAMAEKVAKSEVSTETQGLREEVQALRQTTEREADVTNVRQQMGSALQQLAGMGPTARDLANDLAKRGENSMLWQQWRSDGSLRNAQSMVVAGVGLAKIVDDAKAAMDQGKESQPVVPEASNAVRPRASSRGEELTKQPDEPDEAAKVMAFLNQGHRNVTDSVF